MDITWTDGTNSYTDNLTGLNISFNDSYNFTHNTQLNMVNSGNITVSVSVDNINSTIDSDTSNNSLIVTINDVPFIPTKRVVFEEAGGTWCPFCPEGIVALESLEMNYPLTAIGIAVHNNDAMMDNTYDNGLNLSNYPSARIDRAILASGTTSVNEQKFIQYYNDRINTFSPVELSATAVFNPNSRNININLSGEFVIGLSGDYRFNAVILENGVGPYNQLNNFSGWSSPVIAPISGIDFSTSPNPVSILFDNVARAILGGFNGSNSSLPSTITQGSTHTYQYTHTLPSTHNEMNIQVVGMVIDNNTGEILNGVKVNLGLPTISENITETNSVFIYPNPARDELKIKGEYLNVEIYNSLGKIIVSSKNKEKINISFLKNGIYTANIQTKGAIISKKFSVIR
jgi:thiol-disulfide isomerase/thioredoxin